MQPISSFPAIKEDLAVVVDEGVLAEQVEGVSSRQARRQPAAARCVCSTSHRGQVAAKKKPGL